MTTQLHRLALALATGFFLIALTAGYWGIVRRDELLERPDNPRRILAEQRGPRGDIVDRHDEVLAELIGTPGEYARHYPYPDLAPVLGYVSPFYGLAGIEAVEDATLHGDAGRETWEIYWQETIGQPFAGRAVRLTIDLQLQRAADAALGDDTGALVVVDVSTGEILALASHPTFDPNLLDDNWRTLTDDPNAPLLNRATLALYQPGGALQPVLLAATLDHGLADVNTIFPLASVNVSTATFSCRETLAAKSLTLAEAFQYGCPAPFAELGERLGAQSLNQLFTDLRLYEAPALGLPSVASPLTDTESETALMAIGQGSLTFTPLHLALLTAAIANHGELPAPQIILATQNPQGAWERLAALEHPIAALTPQSAEAVKALMPQGHSAVAHTGPEGSRKTLAWFSGFAPFDHPRVAVAVLLENGDLRRAREIGQAVLAEAQVP